MLFHTLAITSALAAFAAADISPSDIPMQCTAVCADLISLSSNCDDKISTYFFAALNQPTTYLPSQPATPPKSNACAAPPTPAP
jgi:hypothetical protein